MDDEQINVEMGRLVADVYELAGVLRRDGEQIAKLAGQTQARWQVMSVASAGRLSVAMIARRLGITRQSVQRVADEIVTEELASFEPNPDHQRSPLVMLTPAGQTTLDTINHTSREHHLQQAAALGQDGIGELRRLLSGYRDAVTE
jgi:DNA-binding MarR family transcriptional regulator